MITFPVAILCLLLCLIINSVAFGILAFRSGFNAGCNATVRRLILAKDQECWTAAHYLEADAFANAETRRMEKRLKRQSLKDDA